MLKWAFVFLLIAIVAGIFGFSDVEAASATIAQWLFGIFLVSKWPCFLLIAVVAGIWIHRREAASATIANAFGTSRCCFSARWRSAWRSAPS